MITMMTQRGCVASCAFCNTPQIHGSSIRGWSTEQVTAELVNLTQMHKVQEISFVDDVFTNRPGGPRKLCNMIVEAGLDLTWYCNVRADQVTPKMARAMADAGCHQVFLGFESGCDEMLKRINKGETVADLERGAGMLKDAGIHLSIGCIVGLPSETQGTVNKSIALCNRVKPYRAQFTRFTPIPGSKLADHYDSLGAYGFHNRSGDDQVETWLKQCYNECHYKPSV
jgi:anaerobic magnesium-protoporphyrin IX monomethyl ester cyclase